MIVLYHRQDEAGEQEYRDMFVNMSQLLFVRKYSSKLETMMGGRVFLDS